LTGQAIQAAQVNLAATGLQLGRRSNVFTDAGAPGSVVRQRPLPGTPVDRSTPVDVMVSLENTSEVYVMPDLVNLRGTGVRLIFEGQGFRLGSIKYEPYEGVEEGVVLRQYPLPGHPLRRHDVISLVVAANSQDDS
jgi:beta-lactam-binding protein with PASTA domain